MPDLIGQSIGRYHILEKLGQGGMAVIYKAYDTRLECDVAIKMIRTELFGSALMSNLLKRFEREAKETARLKHPNIVGIIDYGDYEGTPYLVMEYLSGGTLKQWVGKPMPYQKAAALLLPIARALDYAHRRNILHRDVKPSNILITEDGEPLLTDFGVAKLLETAEGNTLTGTGVGVGTPEYMAPEQWLGNPLPQSDIYALGVVYYELVTGKRPYAADTPPALMIKHIYDPLPRPREYAPGLPDAVEHILFKALAKKPEERYTTMADFAAALEKIAKSQGETHEISKATYTDQVTEAGKSIEWITQPDNSADKVSQPESEVPTSTATPQQGEFNNHISETDFAAALEKIAKSQGETHEISKATDTDQVTEADKGIEWITQPDNGAGKVSQPETEVPTSTVTPLQGEFDNHISDALKTGDVFSDFTQSDPALNSNENAHDSQEVEQEADAVQNDRDHTDQPHTIASFPVRREEKSKPVKPPSPLAPPKWVWGVSALLLAAVLLTVVLWMGGGSKPTSAPEVTPPAVAKPSLSTVTRMALPTSTVNPSTTPTIPPTPTTVLGIGSMLVSPVDGMAMMYVPEGEFWMGNKGYRGDELPVHKVYLDAFWIDRTEVTNTMYARCVQTGKCSAPVSQASSTIAQKYGNPQYDGYPVTDVSWNQAYDYCQWAGRRLLSEAEWEKAARGTGDRIYPWGNQPPAGNLLNYCDKNCEFEDRANLSVDDGYSQIAPSGNYPDGISPSGNLDMAGNVMEWVADWYGSTYYKNSPYENPSGPSAGNEHVIRGGSWKDDGDAVRTSRRAWGDLDSRGEILGFRCGWSESGSKVEIEPPAVATPTAHISPTGAPTFPILFATPLPANPQIISPENVTGLQNLATFQDDKAVWGIRYTPDGQKLIVWSYNQIRIIDLSTGNIERQIESKTNIGYGVGSVSISQSGNTLAGAGEGEIYLWDFNTGQLLHTLQGHVVGYCLALSPDGNTIATGWEDGLLRIWDTVSGKERFSLTGHTREVLYITFSRDGRTLASGSLDNTIRLWDPANGVTLRILQQPYDLYGLDFSPDGRMISSGASDRNVRIWDLETDELLYTLSDHQDFIEDVAFSPDGRILASSGYRSDRTIRLWDPASGQLLNKFGIINDGNPFLAFSPDGRLITTAGKSGIIRIWGIVAP